MGRLLTGMTVAEMVATMEVLDQHGVSPEIFAKIRRERDTFGRDISRFMIGGGVTNNAIAHTAVDRAREIMGRNFLGADVVVRRFEISMTNKIAKALSMIPFTEEMLMSTKDDHILVADFGISLIDIQINVRRGLFYIYGQSWYESRRWAKEREIPRWRLVRRAEVPGSLSKDCAEQRHLIQANEIVPSVRQMAYVMTLNCLENKYEHLFKNVFVRTSDGAPDEDHVTIGSFDDLGFCVGCWNDDIRNDSLGIASAKKPSL